MLKWTEKVFNEVIQNPEKTTAAGMRMVRHTIESEEVMKDTGLPKGMQCVFIEQKLQGGRWSDIAHAGYRVLQVIEDGKDYVGIIVDDIYYPYKVEGMTRDARTIQLRAAILANPPKYAN